MKHCVNHMEREALSICHNCGKDYCEKCLVEGEEYYYCKKPECQSSLIKELKSDSPTVIVCPICESELELSPEENLAGKLHCPECEAVIDFRSKPPRILDRDHYVELAASLNQGDVGLIKSILDDIEVDYYVFGENFLGVGPLIQPARFFVNEEQAEKAKDALKDFEFKAFGFSKNDYGEEDK